VGNGDVHSMEVTEIRFLGEHVFSLQNGAKK
jgi:hypothetical protein